MFTLNLLFIITETGKHLHNGGEPWLEKNGLLICFLESFFAFGETVEDMIVLYEMCLKYQYEKLTIFWSYTCRNFLNFYPTCFLPFFYFKVKVKCSCDMKNHIWTEKTGLAHGSLTYLGTAFLRAGYWLLWDCCSVPCRLVSDIPGLCPLGARSTFSFVTTKNVSKNLSKCPLKNKMVNKCFRHELRHNLGVTFKIWCQNNQKNLFKHP